jgi:hypothetical protein
MNREFFIECLESIRLQFEHDNKCHEAFKIILPQDYVTGYDHHCILDQLLKILKVQFNDTHIDSWIEYFIYEMDFGKQQTETFKAWRKDGSPIDLSDAGKLWDFLQEQLNSEQNPERSVATKLNSSTDDGNQITN